MPSTAGAHAVIAVVVLAVWLFGAFTLARLPSVPSPVPYDLFGVEYRKGSINIENSHFVLEAQDSPVLSIYVLAAVTYGLIGALAVWFTFRTFPLAGAGSYIAFAAVTAIGGLGIAGYGLFFGCEHYTLGASSNFSWLLAVASMSAFGVAVVVVAVRNALVSSRHRVWPELIVMGVAAIPALLLLLPTLFRMFPTVIPC